MRTQLVEFAGKKVTIREKKIKELKALGTTLGVDFKNVFEANEPKDVIEVVTALLGEKLPEIFPELTESDIDEAYMSEVEGLVQGFVDVNFLGLKKAIIPMLKLTAKQSSSSENI